MLKTERRVGISLNDRQRIAWLRLFRSENIGPIAFRDLINHYGSAENALEALPSIAAHGGAVKSPRIYSLEDAEREIELSAKFGASFIGIGEANYPPDLRHIDAPPPLICAKGNLDVLTRPSLGIVGSRNASINGVKFAAIIANEISAAGYSIASGLARGIDTAAHKGSAANGTIAMLAGGINCPYPPENRELLEGLYASQGVAITEMPFGWQPKAQDFPRRNRLIAGTSLGLVVVEAAQRSGSLITARLAANFGRLVFAVPGSPLDPRASGTNGLIREGATLVTCANDILEALDPMRQKPLSLEQGLDEWEVQGEPIILDDQERILITSALSPSPSGVDDIIRITGQPASLVQMTLLELELAGRLHRQSGGRVSLRTFS